MTKRFPSGVNAPYPQPYRSGSPLPISLIYGRRAIDWPIQQHRAEAAVSEAKQQWFAAAFHRGQLLAAKEADADKLQERRKRCEDRLLQP